MLVSIAMGAENRKNDESQVDQSAQISEESIARVENVVGNLDLTMTGSRVTLNRLVGVVERSTETLEALVQAHEEKSGVIQHLAEVVDKVTRSSDS